MGPAGSDALQSDVKAIHLLSGAKPRVFAVPKRHGVVDYDNLPVAALPMFGLPRFNLGGWLGKMAAHTLVVDRRPGHYTIEQ